MLDKLKPVKITDAYGATHTGICQIMYYINQMILPYDKSLMETIKKEHIEDPEDILLIKINNTALYSITREKLYYNALFIRVKGVFRVLNNAITVKLLR
jgi:hypothetical protein